MIRRVFRRQNTIGATIALAMAVVGLTSCASESAGRVSTETDHVLRVQGEGAGSGTVTTPDASPQLSCAITSGAVSGVCATAYPNNSAVRLVATPTAGS